MTLSKGQELTQSQRERYDWIADAAAPGFVEKEWPAEVGDAVEPGRSPCDEAWRLKVSPFHWLDRLPGKGA